MTTVTDQISNHMEFLGYEVSKRDNDVIFAKHSTYFNLIFKEHTYGVLFTAFLSLNATGKGRIAEAYARLNMFNRGARVARAYLDKDNDLVIEACFPGYYDKTAFGVFIETLNSDFRLLANDEVKLGEFLQ